MSRRDGDAEGRERYAPADRALVERLCRLSANLGAAASDCPHLLCDAIDYLGELQVIALAYAELVASEDRERFLREWTNHAVRCLHGARRGAKGGAS